MAVLRPSVTLVPSLHIDLPGDLSVFELGDDVFEDVFAIRKGAVDAEGDTLLGNNFVGYGNAEVRLLNSCEEIGDLLLTDHPFRGAWRGGMAVFDPLGIVRQSPEGPVSKTLLFDAEAPGLLSTSARKLPHHLSRIMGHNENTPIEI